VAVVSESELSGSGSGPSTLVPIGEGTLVFDGEGLLDTVSGGAMR